MHVYSIFLCNLNSFDGFFALTTVDVSEPSLLASGQAAHRPSLFAQKHLLVSHALSNAFVHEHVRCLCIDSQNGLIEFVAALGLIVMCTNPKENVLYCHFTIYVVIIPDH